MVRYRIILGILLVALLAFSPAWAQRAADQPGQTGSQQQMEQQRQPGQQPQSQQQMEQQRQTGQQQGLKQAAPLKVSDELIGKDVQNQQGEDLGEVHDVVLGPDGKVSYVIVSRGGVLGMGENLHPVPKEAISYDQQNDRVLLNIDQQRLEQAPTIQEDDLTRLSNRDYVQQVYGYYGVQEPQSVMQGQYKGMRSKEQQPGMQREQQQRPGAQQGQQQQPGQQQRQQ